MGTARLVAHKALELWRKEGLLPEEKVEELLDNLEEKERTRDSGRSVVIFATIFSLI